MHLLDSFSISMSLVFLIGYLLIVFEHWIDINKTTTALMMGVLCWVIQFANVYSTNSNLQHLFSHFSEVSQIIIFLLGAMIIVEIISAHKGFQLIINFVNVRSKKKLLWIIGFISFFLSSILDNLTTTIVMISIMQKIVPDSKDRMIIGGAIVIAANAGGAWSPIGDVTTTMLWIGGKISPLNIMKDMLIPSIVCTCTSLIYLSFLLKGPILQVDGENDDNVTEPLGVPILILGMGVLMFVPVFKILTGLPPFMGIIFGLSILWFFTDIAHKKRAHLKVTNILSKLDLSGPLFFLGILLAINALETAGILTQLSKFVGETITNSNHVATVIGLASSVVDNIPLVAAAISMYDITQYPLDHSMWKLIAYCAGTGGSILIIGSAAGVVYMGMEKVNFFSYLKKITLPALLGFFAGIITYLIMS